MSDSFKRGRTSCAYGAGMVVYMAHIAGFPLDELLLAAPSGASLALGLRTLVAKPKRQQRRGNG
jgi:hypothetical protein